MIKVKVKSAAKKRFKLIGNGTIYRRLANCRHKFVTKSTTYKNKLGARRGFAVKKVDLFNVKKILGLI